MEGTPPPPPPGAGSQPDSPPVPPGTPSPTAAPPPAPPSGELPSAPASDRASGGLRALGVLGFLILAFACAVLISAIVDIGDTPTCADVQSGAAALPSDQQCFDGSSTQKVITEVLVWPGGVLAGVAAFLALAFAVTGRQGRRVLWVVALAIVLAGLGLLIGSI
jgi:hypothetical protein